MSASQPARPFAAAWRSAFARKGFRLELFGSLAFMVASIAVLALSLGPADRRTGVTLPDPILALFEARDLTVAIFALVHGGVLTGLVLLLRRPDALPVAFRAYALMSLLRTLTVFLTPLEPPAGMVYLDDPIVRTFTPAAGTPVKDLFFSGHTATLLVIALVVPGRRWRLVLGTAAAAVGCLVLVQKAHYTVDVVASVPFSVASVLLARRWPPWRGGGSGPES